VGRETKTPQSRREERCRAFLFLRVIREKCCLLASFIRQTCVRHNDLYHQGTMKRIPLFLLASLALLLAGPVQAQVDTGSKGLSITNTPPGPPPVFLPAPVTEEELAAQGRLVPIAPTNTPPGAPEQYLKSDWKPAIQSQVGGASAAYGVLKVQFPLTASGRISVRTPDGRNISFRATYLVATDRKTGESYVLGQATNAVGEITSDTEVTYAQAFDTVNADLTYRYENAGRKLEQFVVLRENVSLPKDLAEAEDINIECWTAFFDATPAASTVEDITLQDGSKVGSSSVLSTDLSADFGGVKILSGGRAFSFGDETNSVPVGKTWLTLKQDSSNSTAGSENYLIEMVDYATIKPKLNALPTVKRQASVSQPHASRQSLLASFQCDTPSPKTTGSMLTATAGSPTRPGLVLDFAIGSSVPLPPNIVAWWKGENNVDDRVGGFNGTLLNGALANGIGKVGSAFSIAGGTQAAQIAHATALNTLNTLTLECWVYISSLPSNDSVLIAGKDSTDTHQYQLVLCTVGGRWCFRPLIASPGFYYVNGNTTAQANTWYHLAMTYDGSSLRLYVNGTLDDSIAASGTITSASNPFLIGGYGVAPWTLDGRVDEVSLYSRALSAGEIQGIYAAGAAGKDNPGSCIAPPSNSVGWWPGDGHAADIAKGHAANLVNGATYAPGAVGQGFSFDGVNDYAEVPNNADLNPTTGLTLEAWVYQTGGLYQNMPIIAKDGCYSERQYFLTLASSGKFRAHLSTDRLYYFDGSWTVELNTWYHVAMTYDGSWLRLYINGGLNSCVAVSGNILTTTQPLRIGGSTSDPGWGNYKFQGIIDEPTVFGRALSDSEILGIYNAGIAGKCKTADSDGDGLPDPWEFQYFGNLTQSANSDYDADGMSNFQEYIMSSKPNNASVPDTSAQVNLQVFTPLR
jgi:hypothetical protein